MLDGSSAARRASRLVSWIVVCAAFWLQPAGVRAQAAGAGTDAVVVGRAPWVAIARAVMSGNTTGWVKTIHESTYGELLGIVIVGPHATDLIGEAVVALDAEATIETIADGVAPHPTLAEGIKEAGLVALGRAIHLPPRRR